MTERALRLQDLRLQLRTYERRYETTTAAVLFAGDNGTRIDGLPTTAAALWTRAARELQALEALDRLEGEAA
jgi:hypothetical protein